MIIKTNNLFKSLFCLVFIVSLSACGGGRSNNTEVVTESEPEFRLLSQEIDTDVDGNIDETRTFVYDADGNLITDSSLNNNSNALEYFVINTYDNNGNVLTRSEDRDANGTNEIITTFTYDGAGNILTQDRVSQDSDSYFEVNYIYSYDGIGNLISLNSKSFTNYQDSDLETLFGGNFFTEEIYTHDTNGNVLSESRYSGVDEENLILTNKKTFTYDNNGNILTETYSSNNPQNNELFVSRVNNFTYNENNQLIRNDFQKLPNSFDGQNIPALISGVHI